ncbi:MAG: 5'-methylthioadenosine/adenosylhomocysteine nucleosidase [Oscillospiraceae bacterium]|nr:5'-methylthioadenosine/adenosylhomocysteine nucleosidase [Oscillospiraceae bacterium]
MKVGIIGAMDIEVEELKQRMNNAVSQIHSKIQFHSGTLENTEVVAAVSGIGKVNAAVCAQTMILLYSPDMIINTGVAGGLDPALGIGDITVSTAVVQHDHKTLEDPPGYIQNLGLSEIPASQDLTRRFLEASAVIKNVKVVPGIIASGDQFIKDKKENLEIREDFGAAAVEMEGAAIGHTCYLNGLPFCVIRSISDSASESSHMEFWEFVKIACANSVTLMIEFLRKLNTGRY